MQGNYFITMGGGENCNKNTQKNVYIVDIEYYKTKSAQNEFHMLNDLSSFVIGMQFYLPMQKLKLLTIRTLNTKV